MYNSKFILILGVIFMNYEDLLMETENEGISVDENFYFESNLKGLYIDNNIALASSLETSKAKTCILAEELGHYHTTVGNILDMNITENRKQELHARAWAYNKMIGLTGLVNSYEHGCRSLHETADYLNVTEEFLIEALDYYRNKYGICTTVDNYVVYFEPVLGVGKLELRGKFK